MKVNLASLTLARRSAIISLTAIWLAACGSKGDIANLQSQLDGLKAETASVKATADEALSVAQVAEAKMAEATARLNRLEDRVREFETLCKPVTPNRKR